MTEDGPSGPASSAGGISLLYEKLTASAVILTVLSFDVGDAGSGGIGDLSGVGVEHIGALNASGGGIL